MNLPQLFRHIDVLIRQGAYQVQQGKPKVGLQYFSKALRLIHEVQQTFPRALSVPQEVINFFATKETTCLCNIGYFHQEQGDLTQALNYYQQALAIHQAIAPHSTQTATCLNNIGYMCKVQGDLTKALDYFQQALAIDKKAAPQSTQTANRLNNIGFVFQVQGDLAQALHYFRQAIQAVEALRRQAGDSAAREGLFAQHQSPYHGLILCCLQQDTAEAAAEAFGAAEKTRARTLLDRIQEKTVRAETPEQQALVDAEKNLAAQWIAVNQWLQSYRGLDAALRQKNVNRRAEMDTQLKALDEKIHREIPGYGMLRDAEILTTPTLRERVIDPSTLLLSFCVAGPGTVGWAVRDANVEYGVQMVAIGPTDKVSLAAKAAVAEYNLLPRIAAYRQMLANSLADADERQKIEQALAEAEAELDTARPLLSTALPALAERLWNQVRPELKADVTRLIVLPDGELNALPFELLPDGEGGETLGDHYAITYAPSASALDALRDLWDRRPAPPADAPEFFGFGDPDFNTRDENGETRIGHAPIPGTGAELRQIEAYFPGAVTLYRDDVTKVKLNPELNRCSLLHAATHGLFNNDDPLESGLVLAGGEVWEARELLGRRHPLYLELMVASACDTGRGQTRPGEGLIGFSTALMAVGVRCAIVSLWPVDDNATCHFMKYFYEEYHRSRSVQAALQAARQTVKQHPKYADPYFWAGFVAFGLA